MTQKEYCEAVMFGVMLGMVIMRGPKHKNDRYRELLDEYFAKKETLS